MNFAEIENHSLTLKQLLTMRGIKIQIGDPETVKFGSLPGFRIIPMSLYVNQEGKVWVDDEYSFTVDEQGFCHLSVNDSSSQDILRSFQEAKIDKVLIEGNLIWVMVNGKYQKVCFYSPLTGNLVNVFDGELGASMKVRIFKQED